MKVYFFAKIKQFLQLTKGFFLNYHNGILNKLL